MRIISGKNKGRRIIAPENLPVRPTTDLGKESLFNILNNYFNFEAVDVLDLFAGTGNISYEFASREALSVTAVDAHIACTTFISKMATILNYPIQVIQSDVFKYLKNCSQTYDIIFADPPYNMENIPEIANYVFDAHLLKPSGWLIIEHPKHIDFSEHPNFYQHRKYGKLNFTFLVAFES